MYLIAIFNCLSVLGLTFGFEQKEITQYNTFESMYLEEGAYQTSKKVGVKNLSSERIEVAEAFAKANSLDKVVVVYYGTDKELMKKVHNGLQEAANEGADIGGMVIAKTNPEFKKGLECYVFYVHTILMDDDEPIDATVKPTMVARRLAIARNAFLHTSTE